MGLSVFIAHACTIKRMKLETNILETKLIAIRFNVSFACVLVGSFQLNHAISYINYFVFSELDLVRMTTTDEWKGQNTSFLGQMRLYGSKQTELKKCSIITSCKYLVVIV